MAKYEALFEDDANIFGGSPQSKFWDIVNQASDDLVKEQIDRFVQRYTIMEDMLMKEHGEEGLDRMLEQYALENSMEVEYNKKSTYVEWTGEIVCRLDS
jgi:uncharacterized protein involved in exopolysaccharide biosynthesis